MNADERVEIKAQRVQMPLFDPREMNIILNNKRAVRIWRARLQAHLIRTRPYRCDCCGEWLSGVPFDVHEGIVSKGDVQGWKLPQKAWIFSEYNCILILRAHHSRFPLREFFWHTQCCRYGTDVMREWYESLPWKAGVPRRFWDVEGGNV